MDIAPRHQKERRPNGKLALRSFIAHGNRTTMRLELEFWDALDDVCQREGITMDDVIERAGERLRSVGRSRAVRVYLMGYFRDRISEPE